MRGQWLLGGEEGDTAESSTWMSASVTGGQAAKAHSWLLKADADVGTLQRTALESVWHRRPAVCQLFFSHTETLASGYWLGRGVNNHNAKSTELLSRVLTSFERCQLPLLLNQAGLRGGEGSLEGGLGRPRLLHRDAQKLGLRCFESRKGKHPSSFGNCFLVYS